MKKLLLITAGGVAIVALLFTVWNPFQDVEHVAIYKPRSAKLHTQYGAHGAVEVQHQLKKNYFTGQVEAEDILGTRRALTKYSQKRSKNNDMSWNSLGPDNIGGRTRALWIDPTNNNHLIGGGVSGGLWRSVNAANSWEPINSFNKQEDFYQHMTISSITRTGSGIYYVGTGSQHEHFNVSGAGTPGFIGGGLFRSTNTEGTAWENVFAPSPFTSNSEWVTVDAVVVDPNNPEKIWVAHSRGLDTYTHGNSDLDPRPNGLPTSGANCEDVHVSTDGSVIVASIGSRGYISVNGGQSFSAITGNFQNGGANVLGQGGNARIEFAISPSDPDYIYGVAVNTNGSLRAVAATFDRGENWYRIAQDVSATGDSPFQPFGGVGGQGSWDCTIVVNPLNPKHIFLGGLVIYSHTVTGNVPALANWEQRSLYSTNYLNPFAVHPDIHWFVWDSNNVFYAATDGGFFKSHDMATSNEPMFYPANKGYVTTQFYGIAHSNDERTIGGTQDNGTLYQNQMGVTPNQGIEVFGGDGFDAEISFVRPELLFGSSQNGNIFRSLSGNFGENISPTAGSSDFTTNLRLVETDYDPYSTRGNNWGVDTLNPSFVPSIQEWENGNITLGYIPEGYTVQYNSVVDQRDLWKTTGQKMYYYKRNIERDTVSVAYQDTTDIITNINLVDSVLTPLDTNYVLDCDTLFNQPLDTAYVDSCIIFLGEQFCIHIDTIVSYQDTIICVVTDTSYVYDVDYVYDTTYTYITEEAFEDVIYRDTTMHFSDSMLLVDPVQSLFVVGFGSGQGVWVTRDALNTSIEPEYWNVDPSLGSQVNCLEWSPDRNHLYVGTISGQLKRYSGFNSVYHASDLPNLTSQVLISNGPPISDIAVDYSAGTGGPDQDPASEMVLVTKSTYGTTDKVMVSMNAASASTSNTFSSIWNIPAPLNRMPVFTGVIEKSNPDIIIVGTEVGIFRTNNGGNTWTEENGGMMDRAPVFDLRQQYRDPWKVSNSGIIYAGTHGRGIFNNTDFHMPTTGIDDDNVGLGDGSLLSNLMIYPNPMTTTGWVEFNLATTADVQVSIFNINGTMVNDFVSKNRPKGENHVQFDASRLTAGTYILMLQSNGELKTGKFIVTQ